MEISMVNTLNINMNEEREFSDPRERFLRKNPSNNNARESSDIKKDESANLFIFFESMDCLMNFHY
ncbi:hypothetical protein J4218_00370 [Candidatus Pacearchaeota archaeon]|nr:hypothetical protein [Candidatus Pacearchaeota archaeon]